MKLKDDECVECFKHGCYRDAVTWEIDSWGECRHPNALCLVHAKRPDSRGTLLMPTQVRS